MIANYYSEIKVAIFQSVSERQGDDRQIAAESRKKIACAF